MFWSWTYRGENYVSWGKPRSIKDSELTNLNADFQIEVYKGKEIKPEESVLFSMQGDSTLGMGDSIWLISFMRDVYRIKARRRCKFAFASSYPIQGFYKNFLPKPFEYLPEYITRKQFDSYTHKLPAMYYWKDDRRFDKSWVDNRSILERLYRWVGMEYTGLPDWGEFTNEEILYPNNEYYKRLKINPKDKYVFFQWHSSGHSKNLPPAQNIKLIKHIVGTTGFKVYIIGRLKCLDKLNELKGVVNLSSKTKAEDVFSLAFNSEFLVSPDSAGVHLGEAYRIPSVGIMATLPPVYIASKYRIPAFMFGSGKCPYKPCGNVHQLPLDRCPEGTGKYCNVLSDINLELFDRCLEQTYKNRSDYRKAQQYNFYEAMSEPITLY